MNKTPKYFVGDKIRFNKPGSVVGEITQINASPDPSVPPYFIYSVKWDNGIKNYILSNSESDLVLVEAYANQEFADGWEQGAI